MVPVAQRWAWMGGHLLMLLGVLVLLVLGGVWVDAQAQIAAAQGDAPTIALPVSAAVPASPPAPPVTPTTVLMPPAPSPPAGTIPVVNRDAAAGPPADAAPSGAAPSTITRLVIPAIGVDHRGH